MPSYAEFGVDDMLDLPVGADQTQIRPTRAHSHNRRFAPRARIAPTKFDVTGLVEPKRSFIRAITSLVARYALGSSISTTSAAHVQVPCRGMAAVCSATAEVALAGLGLKFEPSTWFDMVLVTTPVAGRAMAVSTDCDVVRAARRMRCEPSGVRLTVGRDGDSDCRESTIRSITRTSGAMAAPPATASACHALVPIEISSRGQSTKTVACISDHGEARAGDDNVRI